MAVSVAGSSRLYPIIGDPIEFVESPVRLSETFARRGADAVCVPLQVADGDLDVVMAALAVAGNVDGLLVTMPHKRAAFRCCATTSERAAALGVVSVIRREPDGTWHGDMLDGLSFVRAQRDRGAAVEGGRALLVGAGGAGSAIALALLEAGVDDLVVHDVDADRESALIELVDDADRGRTSAGPADPTGRSLVFNASPLGMAEGDPLPVDPSLLSADMFVGDVVAGHGLTPFLAAAQAAGCATADGSGMVVAAQDVMADFFLGSPR